MKKLLGVLTIEKRVEEDIGIGLKLLTIAMVIMMVIGVVLEYKAEQLKEIDNTVHYRLLQGDGYLTICNNVETDEEVIVNISKEDGSQINYNCYLDWSSESFNNILLTDGVGQYHVRVYFKNNKSIQFMGESEVYSDGHVDYSVDSYNIEYTSCENVEVIDEIISCNGWTKDTSGEEIFNYFKEFEYDYEKELQIINREISRYKTDIEQVATEKKGVCIDIAVLIACVERRLGRNARICVGTDWQSTVYHSWAEVEEDGKWKNMDTIGKLDYENGIDTGNYEIVQIY